HPHSASAEIPRISARDGTQPASRGTCCPTRTAPPNLRGEFSCPSGEKSEKSASETSDTSIALHPTEMNPESTAPVLRATRKRRRDFPSIPPAATPAQS